MHTWYLLCIKWDITFDLFTGLCLPQATVVSWSWRVAIRHPSITRSSYWWFITNACMAMHVNKVFKCEQGAKWLAICFLVSTNFIVRRYCRLLDGVNGVIYLCRCVTVYWLCGWWRPVIIWPTYLRCANFRQLHHITISLVLIIHKEFSSAISTSSNKNPVSIDINGLFIQFSLKISTIINQCITIVLFAPSSISSISITNRSHYLCAS